MTLLPVRDLSAIPESDRETVLRAEIDALAAEPFNLETAPLFKARLFKLADDHHALFFTCHHIIWDGWSFDILYAELDALYTSFLRGDPSPLTDLPVTYGDFAEWHRGWLGSDEITQQTDYWVRRYAALGPVRLPLPDRRRIAGAQVRGASESMHIGLETAEALHAVAKRSGTTLSMVVLSVYAVVMSQWMGEPVPSIGMPVRGRPDPDLEGVMGFFNNMLPLRLPVRSTGSCLDWIRDVHGIVTEAFANQDVPFEIVAQRVPGNLYQVMFSFQDARARQTHWGPLGHQRIPVHHSGATEDVNLWMVEIPSGIEAGIQYNADAFLPTTARLLRDRLLALIGMVVAEPEQPVAMLLRPTQLDFQRLSDWKRPTRSSALRDLAFRLDELCKADPEAMAVLDGQRSLTRKQVRDCVTALAAELRGRIEHSRPVVQIVSSDPLVWLTGGWAVIDAGGQVLCRDLRPPIGSQPAYAERTDVAITILDASERAGFPSGIPVLEAARFVPVGRGSERSAPTADPTTPLTGDLLASLALELDTLCGPASGGAVVCVDTVPASEQLLHALRAFSTGACWCLVPDRGAAELLNGIPWRQVGPLREIHGSLVIACEILRHRKSVGTVTVFADAEDPDARLTPSLIGPGVTVLSALRSRQLGLTVAAGILSTAADFGTVGQPLIDGIELVDQNGQLVPVGVPGSIRIGTLAKFEDDSQADSRLVRWRSDGVLQVIPRERSSHAAEAAERLTSPEPAASETEEALLAIWQELLGHRAIGVTDDFFEVGGHSLLALRLMAGIQLKLSRALPLSLLLEAPTIRRMAQWIDGGSHSQSAVLIRAGTGEAAPVFLVHDGDGETLLYRNLAQRLRPGHAVYGLQPLSGQGVSMLHTRVEDMAAHYASTIKSIDPTGPYIVGGLCAGGVIAFEVARQLKAEGRDVAMVAIFDIGDVDAPVRHMRQAGERLRRFSTVFQRIESARSISQQVLQGISLATRKVRGYLSYSVEVREAEARIAKLGQQLRTCLARGEPVPEEVRSLTVRELYFFARNEYRPSGVISGDVALFRATRGDGSEGDRACIEMYADPLFGWSRRIAGQVHAFDVPGGHITMLQEPHVGVLAAEMQLYIDRAFERMRVAAATGPTQTRMDPAGEELPEASSIG